MYNKSAYDPSARSEITVVASGAIAAGSPAAYYWDENDVLTATTVAADANSVRWGFAETAIADTASGKLIIGGKVTTLGGGTTGQLVTAIAASGGVTSAAIASTNADINVLGICGSSILVTIW